MPGVLGTAWGGLRILAIFIVGIIVASLVGPGLLGIVTGAIGVWVSTDIVFGISFVAALLVMGWLA